MSLATGMREAHHDLWERTVRHPFVLDLGDGTLPKEVFHSYMTQDYLFIDSLVKLVATGIAKAPTGIDRQPLGAFLTTLLGAEDQLFKRVFRDMDTAWPMQMAPEPLAATARFNRLLASAARKSFGHIATTLYVTEGVYADWARRLATEGRLPQDPLYRGWVDIHADQPLSDFVAYLGASIDEVGGGPELDSTFVRALRLELAFWNAVYPRNRRFHRTNGRR